eukprot:jgi/Botrbrau1/9740/Bobra.0388s0029.1
MALPNSSMKFSKCGSIGVVGARRWGAFLVFAIAILEAARTSDSSTHNQNLPMSSSETGSQSPVDFQAVRLVLSRAWRLSANQSGLAGLRSIPVRDLLAKDDLKKHFATAATLLGPMYLQKMKIYGRDITYPVPPAVAGTMALINKGLSEIFGGAIVKRTGFAEAIEAVQQQIDTGGDDLLKSLPAGHSYLCNCTFSQEHYRTGVVWMEVWFQRDTHIGLMEPIGSEYLEDLKAYFHRLLAELGFPQTYVLGLQDGFYDHAITSVLKPHHFTPSLSFRVILMMQGICLFPMNLEKQTALLSVLEPLMARAGNVFVVRIERVTRVAPFSRQDANGSIYSYFFVNITLLCAKYEGVGFKSLSQLFGPEGPFVGEPGGSLSTLQQEMERLGLPFLLLKVSEPDILFGQPVVSPHDRVSYLIKTAQKREIWMKRLVMSVLTIAVVIGVTLAREGHKRLQMHVTRRAPTDTGPAIADIDTTHIHLKGKKKLGPMVVSAPSEEVWTLQHDFRAESPVFYQGRAASDTCVLPGGSGVATLNHLLSRSSSCASERLRPLWNADVIQRESLEFVRRPDGSEWVLGDGAFGKVIKGIWDGVHDVAIKIPICKSSKEALIKEVALLKGCRNSNIVQFQGACYVHGSVWLVMEYMPGGNLRDFLSNQQDWTWGHRAAVLALDVARGVAYLHSQNIVHLGLKSDNILLTADGHAKVAHVGLAQILAENRTSCTSVEMGSFDSTAPEIILQGEGRCSADVYSFGVILWELASGKMPIRGRLWDLWKPETCPEAVVHLVRQCLSPDPQKRPTATDVAKQLYSIVVQKQHL